MAEPRKGTNRRKIQGTADKIVDRKTENMDGFMRRKEQSKEDIRKAARGAIQPTRNRESQHS